MDANRLIELARDCGMFVPTEMWWQLDRWERLAAAVTAEMENKSREEVDSLRKDAERYRWFRDNYVNYGNTDPDINRPIVLFDGRWYGGHFNNHTDLDSAIDAAMTPAPRLSRVQTSATRQDPTGP